MTAPDDEQAKFNMSEYRIKCYWRQVCEEINRQDAGAARVKRQNEIEIKEQGKQRNAPPENGN